MTKAKSFKVAAVSDRAELYCAQGCVAGVTSLVLDEPPIHIYESDCGERSSSHLEFDCKL